MSEYHSGAYFVRRSRGGRGGYRAAGVLIVILLVLSAAICLLIVFLPRLTAVSAGKSGFGGKTFYLLAVGKHTARDGALLSVQDTVGRGGAGYIYNDGEYNVIAAVYDREADAKAISSINSGSYCIELSVPRLDSDGASENAALEFLTGEWFTSMQSAADGLQRGNITEAQAEKTAADLCSRLFLYADSVTLAPLKAAMLAASEYSCPQSTSVLSYIHYVHVRAIVLVSDAMTP